MRNLRIPQTSTETVQKYSGNIFKGAQPSKKAASAEKASNFSRIYGEDINSNKLFGIKGAKQSDYYNFLNSDYANNIKFDSVDNLRSSTKQAFTDYMFNKKYGKYSNYNEIKNFEPEYKVKALEKNLDDPEEARTKTTWADYLDAIPYKLFGVRPVNSLTKGLSEAKQESKVLSVADSLLNFLPRTVHLAAENNEWANLKTDNLNALEEKIKPLQRQYQQEYINAILQNPANEDAILQQYETIANTYAPHYQALKGTKYLKDLSTKDKIKQLAGFQALADINPDKAISFLDGQIQNKANDNERGYRAVTKALNDVTIGTVNSFLELSHAIGNEVIDTKKALGILNTDEYYKQKRAFNENNYNDWLQMIHEQGDTGTVDAGVLESLFTGQKLNKDVTSSLGSSYILNALWGVVAGITGSSDLLPNIEFIDKGTDEWGIPVNEMLKARQTGVAINKYQTRAGQENAIWTGRTLEEGIGMAQYIIPSRVASGLAMKAATQGAKLMRGTGAAYANMMKASGNINTAKALEGSLNRLRNKKDALSSLFAVDVANTQIAEAYSQGVKTEVYNANMQPINQAIEASVNNWLNSKEGQDTILQEYQKQGGSLEQMDEQLYDSIIAQAKKSIKDNLLKTEYKDAEEAAYRAAVAAQLTSFYGEKLRMDAFGVSRRQWMYAPNVYKNKERIRLTQKLQEAIKDPKKLNTYTGDFVESVKKGTYREGLIAGGKQAAQGFIDNYLDDVTSGYAKGVGQNLFASYIDKLYNAEGTSKGIGLAENFQFGVSDFINAGLQGASQAAGEWQSVYDGILGSMGTFVGGNLMGKAPKIYKAIKGQGEFQNAQNSKFSNIANAVFEGVSPFWETVQRTRTAAKEGQELAEKYNKIYSESVKQFRDFGAVLGELEKAENDQDSVLRLKDGQHNPIILALTNLKVLEEAMGKGTTPLSLYREQAQSLLGLDINSEEAKSHTTSYLSVSQNSDLKTSGLSKEAQHTKTFELLQKRAQKLIDFISTLDEDYDSLKFQHPNASTTAIAEVLYNRVQKSSWEERLNGLRENASKVVTKVNEIYNSLPDEQRARIDEIVQQTQKQSKETTTSRSKKAPKHAQTSVEVLNHEYGEALLKLEALIGLDEHRQDITNQEVSDLRDASVLQDRINLSNTYEYKVLSSDLALDEYEKEVKDKFTGTLQMYEAAGRLTSLLEQLVVSQGNPIEVNNIIRQLSPTQLDVAQKYLSETQVDFAPDLQGMDIQESISNTLRQETIDAIERRKPVAQKLDQLSNGIINQKETNTGLSKEEFRQRQLEAMVLLPVYMQSVDSIEDVNAVLDKIMKDSDVSDQIKDIIKRAAASANITIEFQKAEKAQKEKEAQVQNTKEKAEKKEKKEEKPEKKENKKQSEEKQDKKEQSPTQEIVFNEDLGASLNPEYQEQQLQKSIDNNTSPKIKETVQIQQSTQTSDQIEESNNEDLSITENRKNDAPQVPTLQGTHVIKYSVKELKDPAQKRAIETLSKETESNIAWVKAVLQWFKDNNIEFQDVIDNELFFFKKAPIHLIRIDHKKLFTEDFLKNHPKIGENPNILTAVKYTEDVARRHNRNKKENNQDQGVVEVNGERYLILGILGYNPNTQINAWNKVASFAKNNTNYNEQGFALVTKADGTPLTTGINNMFLGRRVKAYGDAKVETKSLTELLKDPVSNPRGLKLNQIGLGIQTKNGIRIVKAPIGATIVQPLDYYGENTSGAVYAFIRQNDGKYYPFMIQPVKLNEIKEDSKLYQTILGLTRQLISKDYSTRLDAIKKLDNYLHLSKHYNIHIGKEEMPVLSFTKDGKLFSTFDLTAMVNPTVVWQAVLDAGFRINVTRSILAGTAEMNMFAEAGALSLDVANLQYINGSFSVNAVDEQGNEIKQDPHSFNIENKTTKHSYNFYYKGKRVIKSETKFYDNEGNEITDGDTIRDLNAIMNSINTNPILEMRGVKYWMPYYNVVVKVDSTGNYSVSREAQDVQGVKDRIAKNEEKEKQNKAAEAAKEELERQKKIEQQKEQEELGVTEPVSEEEELGAVKLPEDAEFLDEGEELTLWQKPEEKQEQVEAQEKEIPAQKPKPLVDLRQTKQESRNLSDYMATDVTVDVAGEQNSGTVAEIIEEFLMNEETRNSKELQNKRFGELMEEFKSSTLSIEKWLNKKINC